MTNQKLDNKRPQRVILFNANKSFIGVFHSLTSAANVLGTTATNIHFACSGQTITARNLYCRYCDNDVTLSELERVNLKSWDEAHGLERKYRTTHKAKSQLKSISRKKRATIETTYAKGNEYKIEIRFGNNVLCFDPYRTTEKVSTFKAALKKRKDIQDLPNVLESFDSAAKKLFALMTHDRFRNGIRPTN